MIWFKRSLAKCFDLALFAGALNILCYFLDAPLLWQLGLLTLLPLLFAPIEALLLKCFQTTLGKSFFGLSYDRRFTLASAFALSFKNALLILPLFLPIINIFFVIFYIQELVKFEENRWDELSEEKLGRYSKKRFLRLITAAFTLMLSSLIFAPKFTLTEVSNLTGIEYFIEGIDAYYREANINNWQKVKEEALKADLYFPQQPEFSTEPYNVPKSHMKLEMNQFAYQDAAHNYSLVYTTLPKDWTKWGSSIVLNVAIDHVVDKRALKFKKKCKHYNFPAIQYKLEKEGKTTTGMLVLVGNSMYKIEFEQKAEVAALESEAEDDLLNAFFSSFVPHH